MKKLPTGVVAMATLPYHRAGLPYTTPHTNNQSTKIPCAREIDASKKNRDTTVSNGYLGSRNDEERSKMRYVMRIAEFSESSNL